MILVHGFGADTQGVQLRSNRVFGNEGLGIKLDESPFPGEPSPTGAKGASPV